MPTVDYALQNKIIDKPDLGMNQNIGNHNHDYWVIKEAAKRNIYMGLVPVWGGNVKSGKISVQQATTYATFLANRYKKYSNIIWINGGDIKGI